MHVYDCACATHMCTHVCAGQKTRLLAKPWRACMGWVVGWVSMHPCACMCKCKDGRTHCRTWFPPLSTWILRLEFRPPSLAVSMWLAGSLLLETPCSL